MNIWIALIIGIAAGVLIGIGIGIYFAGSLVLRRREDDKISCDYCEYRDAAVHNNRR